MKKLVVLLVIVFVSLVATSCSSGNKLYVLNWGEYMSSDVIASFEEEYGVKVVVETAESNETMYNNISSQKAPYDIAVPSDYMIQKLKEENFLVELDYSKLTNYQETMFDSKLQALRDSDGVKTYKDYYVPYFWGSLGIMYDEKQDGVKEAVEANGWKVLFERDLLPENTKIGMYASSRDAVAGAELYLNMSLNTMKEKDLNLVEQTLKNMKFDWWGTDDLKTKIVEGNLGVALVYSGDFFDMVYTQLDSENDINFGLYAPIENNNVFFDGLVIPSTSTNQDLAHKFIDYFLNYDNALENAYAVGYCPPITSVYEAILEDEEMDVVTGYKSYYPGNITGTMAEVYQYLGKDMYDKLDNIYTNARTANK